MKKSLYVVRMKQILLYGTLLFFSFLLVLQSPQVIAAVQKALLLCYQTIIPSLFPFFVLSAILTSGSFVRFLSKCLSPVMMPLFGVSGAGALPLLLGMISGYPTGAKVTAELYKKGAITQREAMQLLPFTNNSGPLFMIGAIGTGMLSEPRWGMFLYLVHIVSSLLVGFCFRFYRSKATRSLKQTPLHQGKALSLSEAMSSSLNSILAVCGFILFFSALSACLFPFFDQLPFPFPFLFKTLPEVTAGAQYIVSSGFSLRITLTLLSAVIGFGGICVMMQVAGISSGIPFSTYPIGKGLQGVLAAVITYLTFPFFFPEAETAHVSFSSAPAIMPHPVAILLCGIFLFCGIKILLKRIDPV